MDPRNQNSPIERWQTVTGCVWNLTGHQDQSMKVIKLQSNSWRTEHCEVESCVKDYVICGIRKDNTRNCIRKHSARYDLFKDKCKGVDRAAIRRGRIEE